MWGHNDTPQYWLYGRTYYFAAVAPSNSLNITSFAPTVYNKDNDFTNTDGDKIVGTLSYNNSGTEDLIYSTYKHKALASGNGPVELKFQHLLSKVYLSFENEVDPYINVVISNVKVQALKSSTFNLDTNKWDIDDEENNEFTNSSVFREYSFPTLYETDTEKDEDVAIDTIEPSHEGHTNSCFYIPANKYKITFDVTFKMEGVNEVLYTGSKVAILDDAKLQKGAAYKFKTTITPKIVDDNITTFEIENIQNWNDFSGDSQIAVASKLGGTITLTSDVNISNKIDVTSDLTINLNGKKIIYNGTNCLFNVINSAILTINGNDNANSSMISTDVGLIAAANSGTHIVINGGNHTTAGNTTYQSAGGSINVLGGKFNAEPLTQESSIYKTLDIQSSTGGTIVVSKGSFYQWDPANSANGDLLDKTIDKLKSLLDLNKEYYVVDVLRTQTIQQGDTDATKNFKDAITDQFVTEVYLGESVNTKDDGYKTLTINHDINIYGDNTHTITGGGHKTKIFSMTIDGCEVILKDLNIYGGGLHIKNNAKVTLINCTITHFEDGNTSRNVFWVQSDSDLLVKDCTVILDHTSNRYIWCDGGHVTIDGGTFKGGKSNNGTVVTGSIKTPILVTSGDVKVIGGTHDFNPSTWVDQNLYQITHSSSNNVVWYTVSEK